MYVIIIFFNPSHPFFSLLMKGNALDTANAISSYMTIGIVLRSGGRSQIAYSVVGTISVFMIYSERWPFTVAPEPHQVSNGIFNVINPDAQIPVLVSTSGKSPGAAPTTTRHIPDKNPGVWVIGYPAPKLF